MAFMSVDLIPGVHEQVTTAGERATLEAFLDHYRSEIISKVDGVSDADARRRLVASPTTLIGLVKHVAAVERSWFQRCVGQRPAEEISGYAVGDEPSWQVGPDETVADVIAEFSEACAASRRVAAELDLDDTVPHERLGRVSLRWVYVHMIQELARHAGHADILREQIDATTD